MSSLSVITMKFCATLMRHPQKARCPCICCSIYREEAHLKDKAYRVYAIQNTFIEKQLYRTIHTPLTVQSHICKSMTQVFCEGYIIWSLRQPRRRPEQITSSTVTNTLLVTNCSSKVFVSFHCGCLSLGIWVISSFCINSLCKGQNSELLWG